MPQAAIPGLGPDLTDPMFFAEDPHPTYARLRAEDPVHWSEQGRFWALSKYDDVRAAGKNTKLFSSTRGTLISDAHSRDTNGPHMAGATHLIRSDAPTHTELRKLIAGAFTPKAVARMREKARQIVRDLIAEIDGAGVHNAVEAISAPATTYVIAELLGVPRDRWSDFWRWTNSALLQTDARNEPEHAANIAELLDFFRELCAQRRKDPQDDVVSSLVHAEFRGEPLSEVNLLTFCKLLLGAGTETTRGLITGGIQLLSDHPEQRERLASEPELMESAVEEMLRLVSPVVAFARTATAETEVRGRRIARGDYVVLLYQSANRDEEVWADPDAFDITRPIKRNLAFGFGPHICIGAPLARMEAAVIFGELLAAYPHFDVAGPPVKRGSTLVSMVLDLPVAFGGR
ncbi:cytochrome P450 [Streptomyces sulphureus]|uniref:cytochrome P450 n=1 Tax=Streptomyces sulphureus TaxID=47758 RepID=UPI00035D0AEB|nr:cytochrome P450 [Streptomyces sulphureus]